MATVAAVDGTWRSHGDLGCCRRDPASSPLSGIVCSLPGDRKPSSGTEKPIGELFGHEELRPATPLQLTTAHLCASLGVYLAYVPLQDWRAPVSDFFLRVHSLSFAVSSRFARCRVIARARALPIFGCVGEACAGAWLRLKGARWGRVWGWCSPERLAPALLHLFFALTRYPARHSI